MYLLWTVVAITLIPSVRATESCSDVCGNTTGCDISYCKENGLCYGLYHENSSTCFYGVDPDCDDTVLTPVSCGNATTIRCTNACNSIDSCVSSDSGSYCKTWADPPVCFGIKVGADESLCYDSEDGSCEGEPLLCSEAPIETTEAPSETTEAPYETTEAPYETTEAPYETTEAPNETTEAPYETSEAPYETTEAPYETTEAPYETTEAPYETTEPPYETTEPPYETTEAPIVTIFVSGQPFTATYYLDGYNIVIENPDPVLESLLSSLDSTLLATYTSEGIYVELVNVFSTTLSTC
ncbi:hypothetical protein FOL47_000689 [Perkinsus chesapeaki]|uniref:Uncharacterized protein n=1 Tax=Perkinsus chesapeaki TaxID=330153 RepID=A0A7J6MLC0_PERCH|nr:hypothetical protein FOL47_000689 [Perkinsus chesapeaki]